LILAVFLLGLGIGSAVGARLATTARPRFALALCQLALCAAITWSASIIATSLPYWPLDVTVPTAPSVLLQIDMLRTGLAVLPAALLWGASFPLALAAAAAPERDCARLVGDLYAANTLGAIVGALGATFLLVPELGGQRTQQLLVLVSAGSALLAGAARAPLRALALSAAALLGASFTLLLPALPPELVAYGRFTATRGRDANVLHVTEGVSASLAVTEDAAGIRSFHSAGKAQASTYPQDLRLQRMLGHLTTLAADDPRSVLVIGLGAGATAGAVSLDPAVERVTVAEIEPRVVDVASSYFAEHNFGVLDDPKVSVVVDDGRHVLATTAAKFDAITADPLDPWVKGAAALYTVEFWQLVKSRVNAGGVVTVFVQLYESTEAAVRSELATFFAVFPNGAVFANTVEGKGYDVVLLARADGTPIDVDRMHTRWQSGRYAHVAQSLADVGFRAATELLATYAGGPHELADWLAGAELNRDRNLRLQYLAGEGLNAYRAEAIFAAMTAKPLPFPRSLFVGSPARLEALRQTMRALP
jgi:spermidine synthase